MDSELAENGADDVWVEDIRLRALFRETFHRLQYSVSNLQDSTRSEKAYLSA